MWFKRLTGFSEKSINYVQENIELDGEYIISKVNGNKFKSGILEIPKLEELRKIVLSINSSGKGLKISEVVADVSELHKDKLNNNAVFQAASQFNLLEMVNPFITPEDGIDIYENDYTQGPACAIACGAGTIYRNYFVKLNNQIGQSKDNQINCLEYIGNYFNNEGNNLWEMSNGYALINKEGLSQINSKLKNLPVSEYEKIKGELQVGIQWNTRVTIGECENEVTQVYCSALPIKYTRLNVNIREWELISKLILEATYEATFLVAIKNYLDKDANQLYLTLVGGGVFGNPLNWILDSINKSALKFREFPLDVKIVSYGYSNPGIKSFAEKFNSEN